MSNILFWAIIAVVVAILIKWSHDDWVLHESNSIITGNFPPVTLGTVIITDAAYGNAREIAHLLVDYGFHVLAGVNSEAEARSFAYDQRKGYVQ